MQGQDAVFDRCKEDPVSAMPAAIPADAPLLLRSLRQYQRAAASFYAGDFTSARREFDAIAVDVQHPMRHWAALASLRCTLREASLNLDWQRAFNRAYREQGLRGAELNAVLALAGAQQRERNVVATRSIEARAAALLKDAQWAPIHPEVRVLVRQAVEMLTPLRMLDFMMTGLDRLDGNPYADETLERWAALYPRVLPARLSGPLAAQIRRAHPFFDWTQAMQACTGSSMWPSQAQDCDSEHAHAMTMWRDKGGAAWLLAVLVTMRQPSVADDPAIAAVYQVRPDQGAAWPSMQYHLARALQAKGDPEGAMAVLEPLLRHPDLGSSGLNLVRQLRLSLAGSLTAALPDLVRLGRRGVPTIGTDGAELIDRTLSSAQLLAMAQESSLPAVLRNDLAVAAWLRADLLERVDLARQAATLVGSRIPNLQPTVARYVAANTAQERHEAIVWATLDVQLSPQVYHERDYVPGQKRTLQTPAGRDWCGFDDLRHAQLRTVERVPAPSQQLYSSLGAPEELKALQAQGTGPQWFAKEAMAAVRRTPGNPANPRLLQAVMKMTQDWSRDCPMPDAASWRAQAQGLMSATR